MNKNDNFSNALNSFGKKVKETLLCNDTSIDLSTINSNVEINILKKQKLLTFNQSLLLDTILFDYILYTMDAYKKHSGKLDQNMIQLKEVLVEYKELIQWVKTHFNNEVLNLNRKKINIKGIFHEEELSLSDLEKKQLSNKNKNELSIELYKKIIVDSVTEEDIIKVSEEGKKADWLSYIKPNGRTFKYTVLVESELTRYGLPVGFYTKAGQAIDLDSFKNIFYKHPVTGKTTAGVYFEVSQSPGELGNGGINGIIAPADKPLVVIDHSKNEAYYLNINPKGKVSEMPSLGVGVG